MRLVEAKLGHVAGGRLFPLEKTGASEAAEVVDEGEGGPREVPRLEIEGTNLLDDVVEVEVDLEDEGRLGNVVLAAGQVSYAVQAEPLELVVAGGGGSVGQLPRALDDCDAACSDAAAGLGGPGGAYLCGARGRAG